MSPVWGHVIGAVTVVVMATFIGIWIWAWLPWHKPAFDALAVLPMQDHDDDSPVDDGASAHAAARRPGGRS